MIPPERIACKVWLTDQSSSVTESSGTKRVNPAGGKTPVRTQTLRIVLPVATSRRELVTNASARLPGCGKATRTALGSRLLELAGQRLEDVGECLVDRGHDRYAEEHRVDQPRHPRPRDRAQEEEQAQDHHAGDQGVDEPLPPGALRQGDSNQGPIQSARGSRTPCVSVV